MRKSVLLLLLPFLPTIPACEVVNFGMNMAARMDIENLFRWHYAEEVIQLQQANAQLAADGKPPKPIPLFREWAEGKYRDRVTYAKYLDDSLKYPETNPPSMAFEEWVRLPPTGRLKAKVPDDFVGQ